MGERWNASCLLSIQIIRKSREWEKERWGKHCWVFNFNAKFFMTCYPWLTEISLKIIPCCDVINEGSFPFSMLLYALMEGTHFTLVISSKCKVRLSLLCTFFVAKLDYIHVRCERENRECWMWSTFHFLPQKHSTLFHWPTQYRTVDNGFWGFPFLFALSLLFLFVYDKNEAKLYTRECSADNLVDLSMPLAFISRYFSF